MAELTKLTLELKERLDYFPWITKINKRFGKLFPSDYDEETLNLFHREIQKELEAISIRSTKKNEAFFSTLLYFYNHFCWKIKKKKPSPHMKSSCVRILSSICRVGLVLSKGNVQSKWITQVLCAVKVFPGDSDYLYDALLQIYKLNKKYYSAYTAVLRHVLDGPQPKTENPCTFFKLLLLLRRLKFRLQNPYERAQVDALAAAVTVPRNLMSWLADNGLQDIGKAMKKNKMIIMKRKLGIVMLERLRAAVLHYSGIETSAILEDKANQFSIDCNPETVDNELESESLNIEEDIVVDPEANVEIPKSKRKRTVESNESKKGCAIKKRKKDLDHKLNEKGTSRKAMIPNTEVSETQDIPVEYTDSNMMLSSTAQYSDLASNLNTNSPSNSHKKLKKKKATKLDQVPQQEVGEIDIGLNEESKASLSTNIDEIENDSMLIQSYSSTVQSINKGKKKININENDLAHVQSIKKDKRARKTINIVEEINVEDIGNSSYFEENESFNIQPIKKDKKNKTSLNIVQKPKDIENQLVVDDKIVQSAKKGKKRKTINISPEINFSDGENQSESDSNVSLYVQSIGTGKNRRKTINIAQDISQRDIKNDSLYVSSTKKGKKKRKTINIVQEINKKNIEYQSNVDENNSSSAPRSASKKNKTRKSSHFTSADFIVTPCENVDIVAKEDISNEGTTKRNSTSKKNEWIVTITNNEPETSSSTLKMHSEKHKFKVSEIKENLSEVVAVGHIDNAEIESIAETKEAKNIAKPSALAPTPESETANTEDEEVKANESISETESVGAVEEAKSSDFTDETEAIKPSTESVKFVEETETIASTIETVAVEYIDKSDALNRLEESGQVVETRESEEESVEVAESAETVDIVIETKHSADKTEFSESIADTENGESVEEEKTIETIKNVESFEMVEETKVLKTETEEQFDDVGSNQIKDKTKTFQTIADPLEEENVEDEKSVETVAEAVKICEKTEENCSTITTEAFEPIPETEEVINDIAVCIEETKEVDSTIQTEAFESIPETEKEIVVDVETVEDKDAVDIIEETEDINSFNKTEDFESIPETEEETANKMQTVGTVKEVKSVDVVNETEDFETIPETEEETVEVVETVKYTNAIDIIEETDNFDSFNKTEDFEPIPETEEETVENVKTVEDKVAVDIIEETEDVHSFNKTEVFEFIPDTEKETVNKIQTVEEVKAVDIVNETKDFETIPKTEEETVEDVETVQNFIEETEDIDSFNKTEDFETIPETEEETVENVKTVENSEAIEIIEETEELTSTYKMEDFEPIPETEERTVENVETVKNSEAIEIIEETEDTDSTNKIGDCESIPETEEKIVEEIKAIETAEEAESVDIVKETENIDATNRIKDFVPISETQETSENVGAVEFVKNATATEDFNSVAETKEKTVEDTEALEVIGKTETTYSTLEKTITGSIDETNTVQIVNQVEAIKNDTETKTVEGMEVVDMVKDMNVTESIEKTETVESVSKPKALEILESTDDKTEAEDTDELLEILESTDYKTGAEEADELLENFESTDKTEAEDTVDELQDMESISETDNAKELNIVEVKNVSKKFDSEQFENVPNDTQCSSKISEWELDASITKYNSLVKEIFCDEVSNDSVRESLSPNKTENVEKHSIESVLSQTVMSPTTSTEKLSEIQNNASLTKNGSIPLLSSEIILNSTPDNLVNIEQSIVIKKEGNTQGRNTETQPLSEEDYCKILLKEVEEDFDHEIVVESKDIPDLETSNIPNASLNQSSLEETISDSHAQFERTSSTKMDFTRSKVLIDTISNNEKVSSKETVESIAEGLYKKILKAKEERSSLTGSVPENTAHAILTENTVSYVMEKVIKKVEDVNDTANGQTFEDLKTEIKFTPERSQLPKLGNLSYLKPFGFPDEKSECLSFVDVSIENVSDSNEIKSSESSPQANRKDFYPYRNLLAIEVLDDKSESNFSDVIPDDKLEETICVSDEDASSDDESDETEIEEITQSPIRNSAQNEDIAEESNSYEENQSISKRQSYLKLDSAELMSLVRTMQVPVVNLGRKCDFKSFEGKVSQDHKDDGGSFGENLILSTETEKQNGAEDVVESQSSESISQESKKRAESLPEKVASENEEVIATRKLRNRNVSSPVVTDKPTTSEDKHQTPEKSCRTRLRRKPIRQEKLKSTESKSEATSTNLRRSTRKLKKDINTNLRNEFKELRLDSPKRCNPIEEEIADKNENSDANVNSTKSKKLATCSTAAKRSDSAVSKSELDGSDPSVEAEDKDANLHKETSKNLSTRKRATRSTSIKITKYFPTQTKAELTPVNEVESEDQVEDSAESGAENLPVKKRFTRSTTAASDKGDSKSRPEPVDAKEVDSNPRDVKPSKGCVPKRSTRRGVSGTKHRQNLPDEEESGGEDVDTQSNVSEESLKENVVNEDNSASKAVPSSTKDYNLRRSSRNLIRPSRLKLSQDNF